MKSPSLASNSSAQEQELSVQVTPDVVVAEATVISEISALAITALAIANATDTILRNAESSLLLTEQLSKSQLFGEMKSMVAVQRRLGRIATSLARMMRSELQVTAAAK